MNMCFTDRKICPYENMSHFKKLPEFEKELQKLSKKYSSLSEDLKRFQRILKENPIGFGTNFVIVHSTDTIKVVKARLACKSLKDRSIRIIYAYHDAVVTFVYIELYFKGDKENENRERIKEYLKNTL